MAEFVKTKAGDKTIYTNKTDNRQVKAEDLDPAVKEELDLADFGTVVDSDTVTQGDGDGVVDADGKPIDEDKKEETPEEEPEKEEIKESVAPEKINPYRKDVAQSEKGFGFPRKNGKTGDIFDVNVPHTQVRSVAGLLVPLSDENYKTKSDAEIYERLDELKLV